MGKSKKRDRDREKHGILAINGSSTTGDAQPDPEEPRKIARLAQEAPVAQAERAGVNLIEVDGKSCTHEVAWPPPPEDADPAVPSGTCADGHAMLLVDLATTFVVLSRASTLSWNEWNTFCMLQGSNRRRRRLRGQAHQQRSMPSRLIPSSRPPSTAWKQVLLRRSFA